MKKIQKLLVCGILAFAGSGAFAQVNEITASPSLIGILGAHNGAVLDFGQGATAFSLGGSYYGSLTSVFQLGVSFDMLALNSQTEFDAMGGFKLNFGGNSLNDSYYFNPSAGVFHAGSTSAFIFDIALGKRFEILPNLSYAPSISAYWMDGSFRGRVEFIKFSAIF